MNIERLSKVSAKNIEDINELITQLSPNLEMLKVEELNICLRQNYFWLFVAKEKEKIIAMTTLICTNLISGKKGLIEDVVVDQHYRGKGIGYNMLSNVIDIAKKEKIKKLQLTSKPQRIAANEMYKKLGFVKRDTNFYQLNIDEYGLIG